MKIDTRRLWIGRFLLVVYLSILTLGVFHVHEHGGGDFACQDCISHVRHGGHLSESGVSLGDCVLCSFLSASYLVASIATLTAVVLALGSDFVEQTAGVVLRTKRTILLRGPPMCL